jgi:hypothetical protein
MDVCNPSMSWMGFPFSFSQKTQPKKSRFPAALSSSDFYNP